MNRVIFFIILCLLALALVKICKGAENKNTLAGAPPSTTDGGGTPLKKRHADQIVFRALESVTIVSLPTHRHRGRDSASSIISELPPQ
jgi:hypothetical protein